MSPAREALLKHRPQIEKAKAAVEEFLNGHTAHHLLQAIVSNFLAISQAELEEWVVGSSDSLPLLCHHPPTIVMTSFSVPL